MPEFNAIVSGDDESRLYGTFSDLGARIDTANQIHLAAGVSYTDVSPFQTPKRLTFEEGSKLVFSE